MSNEQMCSMRRVIIIDYFSNFSRLPSTFCEEKTALQRNYGHPLMLRTTKTQLKSWNPIKMLRSLSNSSTFDSRNSTANRQFSAIHVPFFRSCRLDAFVLVNYGDTDRSATIRPLAAFLKAKLDYKCTVFTFIKS